MDYGRLSMPLGEATFTQRSIRRFRADPIRLADIRLILEAAVRAHDHPREETSGCRPMQT